MMKIAKKIRSYYNRKFVFDRIPRVAIAKGVLFIHIPKVAGSSVSLSLYNTQIGHAKAMDYYCDNPMGYDNLKTFAIVRNPIQRFVSAYNYLSGGGMDAVDKNNYARYISQYSDINDFVSSIDEDFIYDSGILHFNPQYTFIYMDNRCLVNHIYNLECLDCEAISQDLGLEVKIPMKNKSVDKKEVLSEKSINKLKKMYHKDCYLFGYNL